jgi:RNA polymerase sigma factor (sigma-70 family)
LLQSEPMPYSNEELISGILSGDEKILKSIYKKNFPQIKHFICRNGGSFNDSKDIFNDGLMLLFSKLKSPDFTLTCAPGTFLFSACRLIWFNKQKHEKKLVAVTAAYAEDQYISGSDVHEKYVEQEKNKLFYDHLYNLEESCQTILTLFFKKVPLKEIADTLGLPNEDSAKKRKFLCKKKLLESIRKDPRYAELIERG